EGYAQANYESGYRKRLIFESTVVERGASGSGRSKFRGRGTSNRVGIDTRCWTGLAGGTAWAADHPTSVWRTADGQAYTFVVSRGSTGAYSAVCAAVVLRSRSILP